MVEKLDKDNYFNWFGMDPVLDIDQKQLKKRFLQKSRDFHPDFHTLSEEADQELALENATINNKAYTTLKDFHTRLKYVLSLHNITLEGAGNQLPSAFLMEMMDINESIIELEFDPNDKAKLEITDRVKKIQTANLKSIKSIVSNYCFDEIKASDLNSLKDYYFKHKYLLRIQENLDKFAC